MYYTTVYTFLGEGNGTPLQYSCLGNPMGGGAWWAASMGSQESDMTERLHFHFSLSCIGERDGSPLQCSCLENPRDGGAWWTAIYGVVQSRTRLKWLGSIHFLIYLKCFNFFQNALDKNFILTYLDAPTFDFIYISLWKFSRQTLFLLEYVQLDICFKISSKHLFLCYQTWVLCTGW